MNSPVTPGADGGADRVSAALHIDLPVRYHHNADSGMWGYAIDNPAILGGCHRTRAAAEQAAIEAVAHALGRSTGQPRSRRDCDEAGTGVIRVTLAAHEPVSDAGDRAVLPIAEVPADDRRRVADVMSRAVVGVGAATPRDEIVAALRRFGVSAVPVIDEAHRPLGIVSEADLVAHWTEGTAPTGARRIADRCAVAADLMTAPAITVSTSAPLAEAARLMGERNIRRLVAVRDDGLVAGIVSRHDLLDP